MEIALQGLRNMLDKRSGLLVFTTRPSGPEGQSLRYTCITLIGLIAATRAGLKPGLDVDLLVEGVANRQREVKNLGELGLLLWCLSNHYQSVTEAHSDILRRIQTTPETLRSLNTTEIGWLLTGLSRTAIVSKDGECVLQEARKVYATLRANFSEATGLYCYGGRVAQGPRRWLRRCLGFFDNQVYGICAGAAYYEASLDQSALQMAEGCARRICGLQGSLGQWSWHYNVRTGQVVDRYPVYSVHQHGMAPMALGLLVPLLGSRHKPEMQRSVAWVFGSNELGRSLVDPNAGIIWRSIRRRFPHNRALYPLKLLSLLGFQRVTEQFATAINTPSRLEIDYECRPYELGWLLLALTKKEHL